MSADARQYLLDRFTADAATLRLRATGAQPSRPPGAGPDAETSTRMADACDRVATMIGAIPPNEPHGIMLQSLAALTIPLDAEARKHEKEPMIRSVYAGAATRIRELLLAEQRVNANRPPLPPA